MKSPNRSSAEAIKFASWTTLDVLSLVCLTGAGFGTVIEADVAAEGAPTVGAGVPVRLGSPLTVRSFPWVFMIATGNSANLDSRAGGRRSLTKANSASTGGVEEVLRVQLYYDQNDFNLLVCTMDIGYALQDPVIYPAYFHARLLEC